jgi:hypothetical protein
MLHLPWLGSASDFEAFTTLHVELPARNVLTEKDEVLSV